MSNAIAQGASDCLVADRSEARCRVGSQIARIELSRRNGELKTADQGNFRTQRVRGALRRVTVARGARCDAPYDVVAALDDRRILRGDDIGVRRVEGEMLARRDER